MAPAWLIDRRGVHARQLRRFAEVRDRRDRVAPEDLVYQPEAEERRRRSGLVAELPPDGQQLGDGRW